MTGNSKRFSTRSVLIFALLVLVVACGGDGPDSQEVEGVVSQVTGTDAVASFVVVDDEGVSHAFTPVEGLRCDDAPLSHLRTHLVERDRLRVAYEIDAQGHRIAIAIEHVAR